MTRSDYEGQPRSKSGQFGAGRMTKNESIEVRRQKASNAFENPTDKIMSVPYTRDAYNKLFPEGKVKTPIETVKLGAHQFERLEYKDEGARTNLIGAMSQTLKTPSVVIGDVDDKGRPAKLYIKSYTHDKKIKTTMAVVADINNEHVSISFGRSQVRKKIKQASIIYYTVDSGGRTTGTDFSSSLPNDFTLPHSIKKSSVNADGLSMSAATSRSTMAFLLKQRIKTMTSSERNAQRKRKPPRWLYPAAAEARYAASIRTWVRPVRDYVRKYIKEHHKVILQGDSADFIIRQDAVAGASFALMVKALNGEESKRHDAL